MSIFINILLFTRHQQNNYEVEFEKNHIHSNYSILNQPQTIENFTKHNSGLRINMFLSKIIFSESPLWKTMAAYTHLMLHGWSRLSKGNIWPLISIWITVNSDEFNFVLPICKSFRGYHYRKHLWIFNAEKESIYM